MQLKKFLNGMEQMPELKVVKTVYEVWATPVSGCGWEWPSKPTMGSKKVKTYESLEEARAFLTGFEFLNNKPHPALIEIREILKEDKTKSIVDFI